MYGGELTHGEPGSREAVGFVHLLSEGDVPPHDGVRGLTWVVAEVKEGIVHYGADLTALEVLSPLHGRRALEALCHAAEAVAGLHSRGAIHGDLRPETLRLGPHEAALILLRGAPEPTRLLEARLYAGARPSEVAFVAPEILRGEGASAASDVYALGALAAYSVSGTFPLGQIQAADLAALGSAADAVLAALDARPERRPTAPALRNALKRASSERARALPSMLSLVLALAGAFVFAGVLALALRQWTDAGAGMRLGALLAFTAGTALMGFVLQRVGFERSGNALALLALELTWADAYYVLSLTDNVDSYAAWALASAFLGALHCTIAALRRSVVVAASGVVALGFATVSFGLVVTTSADVSAVGYALAAAAAYAWISSVSSGRPLSYPFMVGSAAWVAAACALSTWLMPRHAVLLVLPYVVALGVHLVSRRLPHSTLPRRTAAFIALGAPALQLAQAWSVPAALAAFGAHVVLHYVLRSRVSAVLLTGSGWVAALAAFARFTTAAPDESWYWLGALAPYAIAFGLLVSRGWTTAAAAGSLLACIPTLEALVAHASPYMAWLCVVLGLTITEVARRRDAAPWWNWVGIANIAAAPLLLACWATLGHDATELFTVAFDPGAAVEWTRTRAGYLFSAVFAAAALLRLGLRQRDPAATIAALVTFFFPVTLTSLSVARGDLFYAGLSLIGGGALLAVGVLSRHALLSVGSAAALFVVLAVQYFAKLSVVVPWSLLVLGFGVALFALGVLYEKKLKTMLPRLTDWR